VRLVSFFHVLSSVAHAGLGRVACGSLAAQATVDLRFICGESAEERPIGVGGEQEGRDLSATGLDLVLAERLPAQERLCGAVQQIPVGVSTEIARWKASSASCLTAWSIGSAPSTRGRHAAVCRLRTVDC
jgi:hypothetical protein